MFSLVAFQSPGRDSGRSRWDGCFPASTCRARFNPLVGIPVVHAHGARAVPRCLEPVSIPWSGFRSFTLFKVWAGKNGPKVSIPWSGFRSFTPRPLLYLDELTWFQSPGRDSGRSRRDGVPQARPAARVSIPWSGFRSFTPMARACISSRAMGFNPLVGIPVVHAFAGCLRAGRPAVSIPWSGFRSFTRAEYDGKLEEYKFQSPGRDSGRSRPHSYAAFPAAIGRFNPLVGIPVVHAARVVDDNPLRRVAVFQSPGRDSGRSRRIFKVRTGKNGPKVSIPWSGFRSFTLVPLAVGGIAPYVSIPWSGFRSFTLPRSRRPCRRQAQFQSPGRDSGRSRYIAQQERAAYAVFQSPGRDSGRSRRFLTENKLAHREVSIPWSGFRSFTPPPARCATPGPPQFQSPGRDSGRSRRLGA